jgi:cytochrome c biogenesis protein CcdA
MICLNAFTDGYSNTFTVEPYLLDVTSKSAVVAFHLSKPLPAIVKIIEQDKIRIFESPQEMRSHFVKITGLSAGFSYRYEVICGDGVVRTVPGDQSYELRTSGFSGESFSFVVYGDPRPGDNVTPYYHQKIVEQILDYDPMFSLVLGDMVDNGDRIEDWHQFFQVESQLIRRSVIYPVLGDNDYKLGRGKYLNFFPNLENGFYRFKWGGVHFFGLYAWDTKGKQSAREFDADSPQMKWFQSEISKEEVQNAPFRIVFVHDPIYISRGQSSEIFKRVWTPVFKKYNVDVVFASWHLYERSIHEGITYIISGGGGAELIWQAKDPFYPSITDAREYHFCHVDVNANTMTICPIGLDGTVFDTITLLPNETNNQDGNRLERNAKRLSKEIHLNRAENNPVIPLILFSYDCSYCRKLLEHDLPRIAREYKVAIDISYYDLSKQGTYDLLLNAGAEYGRQGAELPVIFIGQKVVGGELEIKETLPDEIHLFKKDPKIYISKTIKPFQERHDTKAIGKRAFDTLTFGIVLGAGLLDGINPCAFTTIIFLISYLSFVGTGRKQMFLTGGIFSIAVFLTYLAIGILFYHFVKLVVINQMIASIVNIVMLLILTLFFILSLIDGIRCIQGNMTNISLQLPDFLKKRIRKNIRDFAQNKVAVSGTSFVLGVVIAGMELTCTGQVYLPIVTMISDPNHRIAAMLYLVMYNLAFILPLVFVFIIATFGVTSEYMAKIFKQHIAKVKFGFAGLFMMMAIIVLINLGWL